jgi:hypothetical protein
VFYTCGDGGLFRDRLDHLASQVIPQAAEHSPVGDRPWFVHEIESYDARYTDFIRLRQEVGGQNGTERTLVRLWRRDKLSLLPPFSSTALMAAYAAAQLPLEEHDGCT